MSDVAETPREELKCKKKYLYEHSMFWECNDGSKCQILEDDVCDLLNEQQFIINELRTYNLQHFLEWLVIKGYVTDEPLKDINNVIACVDEFKEYLTELDKFKEWLEVLEYE